MRRRESKAARILTSLSLALATATPTFAARVYHFEIQAGPAGDALQAFLQKTHIEALYLSDSVESVKTSALIGDYTSEEGLRRILEGTGLGFRVLRDPDGEPNYFTVKPLNDVVAQSGKESRAAMLRSALGSSNLDSVTDPDLAQIVVTGTLIHGVQEIAAPLETLDRRRLNTSRSNTVQKAMEMLPVTRGGGPSEDLGGTGNYSRGSAINLRGLGASATLVLIDGRRQPYSGNDGDFVDVSSIPFSAIDRIEVLPDGASALYGSDAVAGVVNIIMKKNAPDQVTEVTYDGGNKGSAEKYLSQLVAKNWSTGHVMATFDFRQVADLPSTSRSYTASADKRPLGGSDFRSINSAPGNLLNPYTLQPQFGLIALPAATAATHADLSTTLNYEDIWKQETPAVLPARTSRFGYLSATQQIGDQLELFLTARLTDQQVSQRLYGYYQQIIVPKTNPYVGDLAASAPYAAISYDFYNDLGPMGVASRTLTSATEFGANLQLAHNWHAVASGSFGEERMRYTLLNNVNPSYLNAALASSDPAVAFNPFSPGNSPKQTIEAIRDDLDGRTRSRAQSFDLTFDGPIAKLRSGELLFAVGAETRKDFLARTTPAEGRFSRAVSSIFSEARIPIVGDDTDKAASLLELSVSGRYERYSDFGSTSNPRVSLRFVPTDSFKVRGSWGTSFRAPKLVDVHDISGNTDLLAPLPDPKSPTGQSVIVAMFGSNPDLHQETASTWTVGADFAPKWDAGLTASATYYQTDYENRVVRPGSGNGSGILLEENAWVDVIQRDPTEAAVKAVCESKQFRGLIAQCESAPVKAIIDFRLRNMAATRIAGLDLRVEQKLETSRFGHFDLFANAGYLFHLEQATSRRSPFVDVSDTIGNPPRLRAVVMADWFQTRWDGPGYGASLTVSQMGSYEDGIDVGRSVAAYTTADLQLSYRTSEQIGGALANTMFALGVSNLLDANPPFVNRDIGYDQANTDPTARSIRLSVEKHW